MAAPVQDSKMYLDLEFSRSLKQFKFALSQRFAITHSLSVAFCDI